MRNSAAIGVANKLGFWIPARYSSPGRRRHPPYQLDRMFGAIYNRRECLKCVRGIVLGEFPGPSNHKAERGDQLRAMYAGASSPRSASRPYYGAAVGHTPRPMLTLPLGVRVRLHAGGEGKL